MIQKQQAINNHIISIVWLLFLILPNNLFLYLFVPIAYIALFKFKSKVKLNLTLFILGFMLLFLTTFLVNVNELFISKNTKDINRLVVLILLFITFGRLRGNAILKPYIYFAISYLVLSQFVYIFDITPLKSLFSIYADEEGFSIEDYSKSLTIIGYGRDFRLGGLFFNANLYAQYLELIMLVLMCEIKQFSKRSLMTLFPLIVISLGAAGSRTSLILFCFAVVFYLYSTKVFSPQKTRIISILFISLLLFIYLFLDLSEMRAFKVSDGMNNSFGVKVGLLMRYLDSGQGIIKILFGNVTGNIMLVINGFRGTDWEVGDLFVSYGILFFILLLVFYFTLFKRYLPKYRVIFTFLLWMFSNTVLCNYRTAALWMLVLGLYYCRSLMEKRQLTT